DVLDPVAVRIRVVDRNRDRLDVPLLELRLELARQAEFGRADRREVGWMGKQDDPGVASPLMELDGADGGVLLEVGHGVAQADGAHRNDPFGWWWSGRLTFIIE